MDKKLKFEVKISDTSPINDNFIRAKVNIMSCGINRNNSHISFEAVQKAIPTIYYAPVVGEWLSRVNDEDSNFGGHGGELVINKNGDTEFVNTTVPYGCVGSEHDANIRWETITDRYGVTEDYLTVDIFLWVKRYPELQKIKNNDSWQSMEISILDGDYENINGKDVYDIKEFQFDALCILGKNLDNIDYNVEPCFAGSQITTYSLNKDKFKSDFSIMLKELKYNITSNEDFVEGKYKELDFTIPQGVKKQAQIGLDLRKEYGRGGTSVGLATARYLISKTIATPEKVRHIAKYFPRHAGDNLDQKNPPSNGLIAWKLWGSDEGRTWSTKLVKAMDRIDEKNLKKSILECLDLNVSLYIYLIINNVLEDNFDHYVFQIHDIKEKSIIVEKKELKLFIEIDNSCLDCIYFAEEMFNIINLAFKYDLKNHYLISNKTREIKTLLSDIYNIIALSDSKNPEEYRESLLIMERALRDLGYRL
mgnify:CR=1 FL=1